MRYTYRGFEIGLHKGPAGHFAVTRDPLRSRRCVSRAVASVDELRTLVERAIDRMTAIEAAAAFTGAGGSGADWTGRCGNRVDQQRQGGE